MVLRTGLGSNKVRLLPAIAAFKYPRQVSIYERLYSVDQKSDQLLIALGANMPHGDLSLAQTILSACSALSEAGLDTLSFSKLYATPCFPAAAGPDYINAAAAGPVPPGWDADRVLATLHRIEARFGRERTQRWGMRTLDLDLIAFGNTVRPDADTQTRWRDLAPDLQRSQTPDTLILPHPRLQDRAFVLVPLCDVAPDWPHPLLGLTPRQMLAALPEGARAEVIRLME